MVSCKQVIASQPLARTPVWVDERLGWKGVPAVQQAPCRASRCDAALLFSCGAGS